MNRLQTAGSGTGSRASASSLVSGSKFVVLLDKTPHALFVLDKSHHAIYLGSSRSFNLRLRAPETSLCRPLLSMLQNICQLAWFEPARRVQPMPIGSATIMGAMGMTDQCSSFHCNWRVQLTCERRGPEPRLCRQSMSIDSVVDSVIDT